MIRIKRDQLTGAVLVLLGIIVAVMTNQFKIPFTAAYPGPKMLPMIGAVGFIVCGAGIFMEGTLSKKEEKPFMVKAGWIRMAACTFILCLYVLVSSLIGYLITTPFVTYGLTTIFAKGSRSTMKGRILFSVVFSLIIYVIYVYAFGLGLPEGALFY